MDKCLRVDYLIHIKVWNEPINGYLYTVATCSAPVTTLTLFLISSMAWGYTTSVKIHGFNQRLLSFNTSAETLKWSLDIGCATNNASCSENRYIKRLETKLQQLATIKQKVWQGKSSCSYCFIFTKLINHLNLHNVIKCSNWNINMHEILHINLYLTIMERTPNQL